MGLPEIMKSSDVEAQGNGQLYPDQMESPQLRWLFIRKVYIIICLQLLLTAVIAGIIAKVHIFSNFFKTSDGFYTFIGICVTSIAIYISLWWLNEKHPWNYVLLTLFTISMAVLVGAICARKDVKIIFLALILTLTMVVGLTTYTFWAVKRGEDFKFLGPFIFAASLMLLVLFLFTWISPLGHFEIMHTVLAAFGAVLACAYIVYDTDNLIKRLSYDQYVIGAIQLYIDFLNLFLSILRLLS